ncbi:MAG: trigger factor [Acidimicrobiales bacterium]
MESTLQPLEGNKVKLTVEVDETEFEDALNAAFRKVAREVRIPGFRPGKAPRRIVEARVGADAVRQEALRDSLPDFYVQAAEQVELDPIAPPDIDITAGQVGGAISFDAVVEVRPKVSVPGYAGLQVTLPSLEVGEDDMTAQIDRMRDQFAELSVVTRPAQAGDHATIDIKGYRHDQVLDGLSADDYLYEVGSKSLVPKLDETLLGAKAGDIFKFNDHVDEGEEVAFQVLVKEVKEKILPEVNDEWATDASEFETVEELRQDIAKRMGMVKKVQAQMTLRNLALEALAELVADDIPESLVAEEMNRRLGDLSHRLEHQGATLEQYMAATGTQPDELIAELKEAAQATVRADLALRALALAESMEVAPADVDEELARLAERSGLDVADVRAQLDEGGQMRALRSDILKSKALTWLMDNVSLVDEGGKPIDRAELSVETDAGDEPAEAVTDVGEPASAPGVRDPGGASGKDSDLNPTPSESPA